MNKNSLVAQLKVFDPKFALNSRISPSSSSHLVSRFPNLIKPEEVNELDDWWRRYRLTDKEFLLQVSTERIPQYWYDWSAIKSGLENPKSSLLSKSMVNLTCSLHSSACLEQIFSQVNNTKSKKTNSLKAKNNR